jgi:TPR repeat protein
LGVPQNYAMALKLWREAAAGGYADAEYNLGHAYANGLGVPQDMSKAAQWWQSAANRGNATAMSLLGYMYNIGEGVKRDRVQAHVWFNLAASLHPPGKDREVAANNRDHVATLLSTAQLGKAWGLAEAWQPSP